MKPIIFTKIYRHGQQTPANLVLSILLTLFVGISTLSCTQEIQLTLDKSIPELVVEGVLTNEAKAHTITLKKTGDYFLNQPAQVISGAVVSLSDGSTAVSLTENPAKPGDYLTPADYKGVPGRQYTLVVSNVDVDNDGVKESYTSSCALNPLAPVDSMSVVRRIMPRQDLWEIKLSMQDVSGVRNFYLSRVYINGTCRTDSINEWGISNDEFFDGKYLKNETISFLQSRKPDEKVKDGDDVKLEVCEITEDYMYYIYEVTEEFRGRNPLFGGQPANIRTNVKRIYPPSTDGKGARGYFAAYSVGYAHTIYHETK